MNDYSKAIDVKEMGKRFKLVRQKLGMTQTKIAEELGTSQLMVFRMEKGENVLSPFFLSMLMYYSQHISLDGLLSKKFDIEDETLFSKNYSLNSIVKAKLSLLREEVLSQFDVASKKVGEDSEESINLLSSITLNNHQIWQQSMYIYNTSPLNAHSTVLNVTLPR